MSIRSREEFRSICARWQVSSLANVRGQHDGYTPLHALVRRRSGQAGMPLMRALVAAGVDINARDAVCEQSLGEPAAHAPSWHQLLLSPSDPMTYVAITLATPLPPQRGATALEYAMLQPHGPDLLQALDLMVQLGADATMPTSSGGNLAVEFANRPAAEVLSVFDNDGADGYERLTFVKKLYLLRLLRFGCKCDEVDGFGIPIICRAVLPAPAPIAAALDVDSAEIELQTCMNIISTWYSYTQSVRGKFDMSAKVPMAIILATIIGGLPLSLDTDTQQEVRDFMQVHNVNAAVQSAVCDNMGLEPAWAPSLCGPYKDVPAALSAVHAIDHAPFPAVLEGWVRERLPAPAQSAMSSLTFQQLARHALTGLRGWLSAQLHVAWCMRHTHPAACQADLHNKPKILSEEAPPGTMWARQQAVAHMQYAAVEQFDSILSSRPWDDTTVDSVLAVPLEDYQVVPSLLHLRPAAPMAYVDQLTTCLDLLFTAQRLGALVWECAVGRRRRLLTWRAAVQASAAAAFTAPTELGAAGNSTPQQGPPEACATQSARTRAGVRRARDDSRRSTPRGELKRSRTAAC